MIRVRRIPFAGTPIVGGDVWRPGRGVGGGGGGCRPARRVVPPDVLRVPRNLTCSTGRAPRAGPPQCDTLGAGTREEPRRLHESSCGQQTIAATVKDAYPPFVCIPKVCPDLCRCIPKRCIHMWASPSDSTQVWPHVLGGCSHFWRVWLQLQFTADCGYSC